MPKSTTPQQVTFGPYRHLATLFFVNNDEFYLRKRDDVIWQRTVTIYNND